MHQFKAVFFTGWAFVALLCFSGCEKWQEDNLDASKLQTLTNMSYGSHSRHELDIALPAHRDTNTPVVIFIHGGAWILGDKSVFSSEIRQFAEAGIACATINYRYASDIQNVHHPALPTDVRKAVDFIRFKSELWKVSSSRIGLVGHSAGGHLSLITSYAFNTDGAIKACASWAGVTDFLHPDQLAVDGANDIFKTYTGTDLINAADTIAWKLASPFWVVNSSAPPTLFVHGTADETVPYSTSVAMRSKLDSLGVQNSFTPLNAQHIYTGGTLDQARSVTLQWFQSNL